VEGVCQASGSRKKMSDEDNVFDEEENENEDEDEEGQ
jgi:hypothetical protein